MITVQQESLDLSLPLTVRYPKMRDLLINVVYSSRGGLNAVAADIDRSPSELTKMLNREHDDQRKLYVDDFIGIIASTRDLRPIQWLTEKFAKDPAQRHAEAVAQLAHLLPAVIELASQAGLSAAKAKR